MARLSPRFFYLLGGGCFLLAPLLWYGSDLASQATAKEYQQTVVLGTSSQSGATLATAFEHATASTGIEGRIRAKEISGDVLIFVAVWGPTKTQASERAQTLLKAMAADIEARGKPALSFWETGPPIPVRALWARPFTEKGQSLAWWVVVCGVVLLVIGYCRKGREIPPRLPKGDSKHQSGAEFDY